MLYHWATSPYWTSRLSCHLVELEVSSCLIHYCQLRVIQLVLLVCWRPPTTTPMEMWIHIFLCSKQAIMCEITPHRVLWDWPCKFFFILPFIFLLLLLFHYFCPFFFYCSCFFITFVHSFFSSLTFNMFGPNATMMFISLISALVYSGQIGFVLQKVNELLHWKLGCNPITSTGNYNCLK